MTSRTPSRRARLVSLVAAGAALAAAATAGASSPNVHMTLSSTTVKGVDRNVHVVATGAVHASGRFAGRTDANDPSRDLIVLRFPKGTITISGKERSTKLTPNLRSCTARGLGTGTFTVVGGTGAYAGAAGSGTYVRHTLFVGSRSSSGACLGQKAAPKLTRYRATLAGSVTIG